MEIFSDVKPFGPYRLLAKVGEGGMAEVFMAISTQQQFQGQFLAIKKLHQRLNENKAFVNLLIHEAKVGVLLNHPGIVTVHDLGSYQAEFFIAMEYIHGKSLEDIVKKIEEGRGAPLGLELASFVILETLRALAFAHALKDIKGRDLHIIHRDVSPGNILLEYKGHVKLGDFGIATAESRLQPEFSQYAMGKLVYMAPEQAINDPVVQASDVYSLGVIFYQLLTGQLPFQSDNANTLYRRIVEGKINDPRLLAPQLPEEIYEILKQALDRSPRKRFRTAVDFFDAIQSFFLKEQNIDFSSRTVRTYYRKKLAEYLRKTFQAEISLELELIQKAMQSPPEEEDFKATMPIEVPESLIKSGAPVEDERTIFEADHTNEATRHYPLTESERKAIIEGLPPKEVLSEREKQGRTSGFQMATIPDYDINVFDGKTQTRNVADKLETTSLGRDELETLKQQMPAMEITNDDELEAFERSTFSGKHPGLDLTDESNKQPELNITMEELQVTSLENLDNDQSSVTDKKIVSETKSNPFAKATIKKTITEKVQLPWILSVGYKKLACSFTLIFVVGLALYFASLWMNQRAPKMTRQQEIGLQFLGELSLGEQQKFFQLINNPSESFHLQQVSQFFAKEYKFYTGREESPVRLIAKEPKLLTRAMSAQANAHELFHSQAVFDFFQEMGFSQLKEFDSNIYIYLLPPPREGSRLPREIPGPTEGQKAFLFSTAEYDKTFGFLLDLARELAFLYGAKDKENPINATVKIPEGLGEPSKNPRFPQTYADLMGYHLMVGAFEGDLPLDWSQVVINPYTAAELGWIRNDQIAEFLNRDRP